MEYTIVDKYQNNIPRNKPRKNGVITKQWKKINDNDIFFFPNQLFSFKLIQKMRELSPIKSSPNRTIEIYVILAYDIQLEIKRDKIFNKGFCNNLMLEIKKHLLIRMLESYSIALRLPCPMELNQNLTVMTDYDLYWYIEEEFSKCETMNQVKKRYKEYVRVWHPDSNNGDNRVFSIINNCYESF